MTDAATPSPAVDYTHSVDELLHCYTHLSKAAAALPLVSAMPLVWWFWAAIKFEIALIGDILLIVPINLVVFIRNLFPGRWSYRSFSWKYLKAIGTWIWAGECMIPSICVRPLTILMLHLHFRNRLSALRRIVVLETEFSEDSSKAALAKIDRAMEIWRPPVTIQSLLLTWTLPLVGPAFELWKLAVPASMMPAPAVTRFAIVTSVSYAFTIVGSSFLAKRGLILGAAGRDAFYPGFQPGPGTYLLERNILRSAGVETKEFPFDIAVLFGILVFGLVMHGSQAEFYGSIGVDYDAEQALYGALISAPILVVLMIVAWIRRGRLGRV